MTEIAAEALRQCRTSRRLVRSSRRCGRRILALRATRRRGSRFSGKVLGEVVRVVTNSMQLLIELKTQHGIELVPFVDVFIVGRI